MTQDMFEGKIIAQDVMQVELLLAKHEHEDRLMLAKSYHGPVFSLSIPQDETSQSLYKRFNKTKMPQSPATEGRLVSHCLLAEIKEGGKPARAFYVPSNDLFEALLSNGMVRTERMNELKTESHIDSFRASYQKSFRKQ